MIDKSQGRHGWIGASDTRFVMSNFDTKTFYLWWLEKIKARQSDFTNEAMIAGTVWEHRILDFIAQKNGVSIQKDEQIKIRKLRLRVNYDGTTRTNIIEVKTHNAEKPYKVSKAHFEQVQVEMYAKGIKTAQIASYALTAEDYSNFFNAIDESRLKLHDVEYDEDWVNTSYLPRLRYLAYCLKNKFVPNINEYKEKEDVFVQQKERKKIRVRNSTR